ncbi:hypothetical protein [Actinomadura rupiterrae]|uniref:hypothetical protein n=1 Tax=Actinomadura rupiterrae TaxID=559627 RepID=UPI0020A2EB57|nr:hypothetical protein [Actinomadura rupiterrae]MCP2336685.1 hypothetical protein [Actinomadura rupiterrae]
MTRSPRRLKEQVRDTVGEQVRDLPLHAVRLAMFGVGRALLLSDRVTRDYKEITEGGGVKPVLGRLRQDVQHTAVSVVGTVVERVRGGEEEPAPRTARARTAAARPAARPAERPAAREKEISVGKPAASAKPAAKPEPEAAKPAEPKAAEAKPAKPAEAKPAQAKPAEAKPKAAAKPKRAEPAKPAATSKAAGSAGEAAELPVPDYDTATLPQLRARLRGLSADQVKLLREYEREHEARADIIRMYENRIAKLNGSH